MSGALRPRSRNQAFDEETDEDGLVVEGEEDLEPVVADDEELDLAVLPKGALALDIERETRNPKKKIWKTKRLPLLPPERREQSPNTLQRRDRSLRPLRRKSHCPRSPSHPVRRPKQRESTLRKLPLPSRPQLSQLRLVLSKNQRQHLQRLPLPPPRSPRWPLLQPRSRSQPNLPSSPSLRQRRLPKNLLSPRRNPSLPQPKPSPAKRPRQSHPNQPRKSLLPKPRRNAEKAAESC